VKASDLLVECLEEEGSNTFSAFLNRGGYGVTIVVSFRKMGVLFR